MKAFSILPENIRNVAIIAHVDHGKTTLVDGLLKSSGFEHNTDRLMDSGELEQEKGITIVSKVTSLTYKGHKINIVDTPGHQDFGGEVERVLSMVDGVLLLVCATEGAMRQTKYVLEKAAQNKLKPIVVINKVDRDSARIEEVEEEILELFFDMEMDEAMMEYKTFFTSAKLFAGFNNTNEVAQFIAKNRGKKIDEMIVDPQSEEGMSKILDYIISDVSQPKTIGDSSGKTKMLISQIEHDKIYGKIIRGKLEAGSLNIGDKLYSYDSNKKLVESSKVLKLFTTNGVSRGEITTATVGDIISIAGFPKSRITDTITAEKKAMTISSPSIDRPMVCVEVFVNTGPLSGEVPGSKLAFNDIMNKIKEETEKDLALEMRVIGSSKILLFGRGELHIGVVLEKMRRENFEFLVSCPKVIMKVTDDVKYEPIENVVIECDLQHVSMVLDRLMNRKANIEDQENVGDTDRQRVTADIPARGLLGLKLDLQSETNNTATIQHSFKAWEEHRGLIVKKRKNSIVSSSDGKVTGYAIYGLEKFGIFMVKPGNKVYKGQVVGLSNEYEENVNVCKEKKLTNIRSAGNDENIRCGAIKTFSIEEAISFIQADEWLEVSKENLRIRKIELNPDLRKAQSKRKLVDNDLILND